MIKSPFKFLDSYTLSDRKVFFGRDQEITELYRRVFESKMLLIYGVSGTGKSSLINCGLASRFDDSDWLPVNVRRGSNIIDSLNDAFNKKALHPFRKNLTVAEKLQSIYLDHFKPVYLIFDQFEELFIFGNDEEKRGFIRLIKEIVKSETQCRILFIIREEFLAGITEFEYDLPEIFSNRFRVEKMKRANAVMAIEGPCRVHNIETEACFSEELIDKLCPAGNDIELTYLQIYLDRILRLATTHFPPYQGGQGGAKIPSQGGTKGGLLFSKSLLIKSGNVSDLLGQFLEEQIREFEDPEKGMAILKSFVSVQGTKKQMTEPEILDSMEAFGTVLSHEALLKYLKKFVDLRILRERDESGHFELRHDALAAKIYENFTAIEKDIIEVRQFIDTAFSVYEKRGKLLTADDLKYLAPYEDKLFLGKSAGAFISNSRKEITRGRIRRRNAVVSLVISMLVILAGFTVWALNERSRALDERETAKLNYLKAKANNLSYVSQKAVEYNPTIALRIAKYALDLDPGNPSLTENISKIYNDNNFYRIISREKESLISGDYSPGGNTFLTGSVDDTARLCDLNGTVLQKFAGHRGDIHSIKFSPDGKRVLTGSEDSTARIWDLQGNVLKEIKVSNASVNSVAFSPDGKSVLTGTDEGACLWDQAGRLTTTYKWYLGEITSVAFSPDGGKILTGSTDSTARLWDINGRLLKVLKGHTDWISSVSFSPDGKYILTGSDDRSARLWDLQGKVLQIFTGHTDYIYSAVFSHDGKYILTGSFDRTARIWDLKGNVLQVFRGHEDGITNAFFLPDDRNILTVSYDNTSRLWDLEGTKPILLKKHNDWVTSVAFSPDGKSILTGSYDNTACLWDLKGNLLRVFTGHKDYINTVSFSPDGKKLLTGSSDRTAILWDIEGNIIKEMKAPEGEITAAAFSPDGKEFLTGTEDSLRLYNSIGQLEHVYKNRGGQLFSAVFSPDSKSFLTGSADSTARLFDFEGNILQKYSGHENLVHSVAFSPDGEKILTGSCDGAARLWDLKGNMIQAFRGHISHIHTVAFSPDGKSILTGSIDKTARLWDLDGNLLQVFSGYGYAITSVAFSPDGRYILLGSDDWTARLREIKKSFNEYMAENSFQELSVSQKLKYGILEIGDVMKFEDEKSLAEAAEFYFGEISKINKIYRAEYIANARALFNRLVSEYQDSGYVARKDSLIRLQKGLLSNLNK